MRVLFDTNVILDVLLDRAPYAETTTRIFSEIEYGNVLGYLCATTITTVHYIVKKAIDAAQSELAIRKLLMLFEIAPVNRAVIESALSSGFTDFEDGVLHESARHVDAQAIVTRNLNDFKKATISVYSPNELANILVERSRRDQR